MTVKLAYPFTAEKIRDLKCGDHVSVSGRIFTGRDRLHKYLFDGGKSPVNLRNGAVFHCGPAILRQDRKWVTNAVGPTTSMRQEPYTPLLIAQHGVRVIIGKGGMGPATIRACVEQGCVYLQAVGGAAQVLNESVKNIAGVHFRREFGVAEALWELDVEEFPAVVAIDTHGRSIHKRIKTASKRALGRILKNGVPIQK